MYVSEAWTTRGNLWFYIRLLSGGLFSSPQQNDDYRCDRFNKTNLNLYDLSSES